MSLQHRSQKREGLHAPPTNFFGNFSIIFFLGAKKSISLFKRPWTHIASSAKFRAALSTTAHKPFPICLLSRTRQHGFRVRRDPGSSRSPNGVHRGKRRRAVEETRVPKIFVFVCFRAGTRRAPPSRAPAAGTRRYASSCARVLPRHPTRDVHRRGGAYLLFPRRSLEIGRCTEGNRGKD